MSADKGGSKADTLVKVVLFFFISLLSFSVGTFVGKQVSDSDHRRMALEGEFGGGRHTASTDEHATPAAKDENKVSEKEVEALTEEFVNKEKTREPASDEKAEEKTEEHGKAEHAETKAEPKKEEAATVEGYKAFPRGGKKAEKAEKAAAATATKAEPMMKAAEKVAHDEAPTDGAKEKKEAPPVLPSSVASSAVGKYSVQVGSFPDEKEAKTRSADLKSKGWNAFYLPATVNGKTWYRVLVGLFNNQDSAKQFRAQFMKEANTQSAIVQKIVQ